MVQVSVWLSRANPIPFGADYHVLRTPLLSYYQGEPMGVGSPAFFIYV